jgi:hypothetical protein
VVTGSSCHVDGCLIVQADGEPEAVGLFQVVREQLLDLRQRDRLRLQPVRVALVQRGATPDRKRVIGGVSHERVHEPVGVITWELRPISTDELLSHQRQQRGVEARLQLVREQCGERAAVKQAAFDRRAGEQFALRCGKLVARGAVKGCEILRFHDLRHAAVSLWISAAWSVKRVQEEAGHADPAMTLRVYAHLWPSELEQGRTQLDAAITAALGRLPDAEAGSAGFAPMVEPSS